MACFHCPFRMMNINNNLGLFLRYLSVECYNNKFKPIKHITDLFHDFVQVQMLCQLNRLSHECDIYFRWCKCRQLDRSQTDCKRCLSTLEMANVSRLRSARTILSIAYMATVFMFKPTHFNHVNRVTRIIKQGQ